MSGTGAATHENNYCDVVQDGGAFPTSLHFSQARAECLPPAPAEETDYITGKLRRVSGSGAGRSTVQAITSLVCTQPRSLLVTQERGESYSWLTVEYCFLPAFLTYCRVLLLASLSHLYILLNITPCQSSIPLLEIAPFLVFFTS